MERMYGHSNVNTAELGIENFKSLKDFKDQIVMEGLKPTLVFNGDLWENNRQYSGIRNLLIVMFQRDVVKNVKLHGSEHVLSFTAVENKILLRSYRLILTQSETGIPGRELNETGPGVDLNVRRTELASRGTPPETPQSLPAGLLGALLGSLFGAIFGAVFGGLSGSLFIILYFALFGALFFALFGALICALCDAL